MHLHLQVFFCIQRNTAKVSAQYGPLIADVGEETMTAGMRTPVSTLIVLWSVFAVANAASAQQASSGIEQSGLVGKLEGAIPVFDAPRPAQLHEAPMLAELVRAGKLPPVEQRVPQDALVLRPLQSVGRYGGILRRGFTGPADSENGNRFMVGDKPLFFDVAGSTVTPNLFRNFEVSPDGKRTVLYLRRGLRWSDGSPFTADDFVFWSEDVYGNHDIVPTPAVELSVAGVQGRLVKIDDATIAYEFDSPFFLFPRLLAGDTLIGGGQSHMQSEGLSYGLYAPAHYLKQFIPKYSSVEKLTAQARAAGFDSWVQLFKFKSDWRLNTELPVLGAWRTTTPINTQVWTLERNPYFYEVDPEGNQLPYLDRIVMTLAENPEVVNLRVLTGSYDYQERFIDISKLPVLLENQERGHFKIYLDLGFNGSDSLLFPNPSYREDVEIGKWLASADFRRALSLGIDRDQLNQVFWLGLGTPGSVIPASSVPESPGEEWRNRWSTHDPVQANRILDTIGLGKKDSEGFRLRTDNGQRLRIELMVSQTLLATWPQQAEMIAQQWRAIGIAADVKVLERSMANSRIASDQQQILMWTNIGTDQLYLNPRYVLPTDPGLGVISTSIARWYSSQGAAGTKPTDPELIKALELFRGASQQREEQRLATAKEIWKMIVEQQWGIGLVGQSPAILGVRVVSDKLRNVPERTCISQHCRAPGGARPEQWFYN
jgi:peptide/nickel transport system substrate-binding protein